MKPWMQEGWRLTRAALAGAAPYRHGQLELRAAWLHGLAKGRLSGYVLKIGTRGAVSRPRDLLPTHRAGLQTLDQLENRHFAFNRSRASRMLNGVRLLPSVASKLGWSYV